MEPEKFHIGVIDLFAVILPGALLAFYLRSLALVGTFGWHLPAWSAQIEGWVLFAVIAYILGHFIFLVGSLVDLAYDALREKFVTRARNFPLQAALAVRTFHLPAGQFDERSINAFQWAKSRLALDYPVAFHHVQRFEADSKFFRSLFLVLVILAGWSLFTPTRWLAVVCAVFALLSLWRYGELRFKSTRQAYWYLIALEARRREQRP